MHIDKSSRKNNRQGAPSTLFSDFYEKFRDALCIFLTTLVCALFCSTSLFKIFILYLLQLLLISNLPEDNNSAAM